MGTIKEIERLITAEEVSDYLSVSTRWVWDAARNGRIPYFRVGKYMRFDLKSVLEALDNNERKETQGV
jgi:excisionase family DNA binding protein